MREGREETPLIECMDLGRVFIVIGIVMVGIGVIISLIPKEAAVVSWFGHLPGDIYLKSDRGVVWIPWVSMLLVSAIVSGVLQLARMLLSRL